MKTKKEHWEKMYKSKQPNEVSWTVDFNLFHIVKMGFEKLLYSFLAYIGHFSEDKKSAFCYDLCAGGDSF